MYNFYEDYNYDTYYEGANLDIRAKLKEATKIYDKNMKDISKAIKAGEYNNARRNIETLRKSLADIREDIERIDASDIDSVAFAVISAWTINWLRKLITIVLIIPTLGLSTWVEAIRTTIEEFGRPVSKLVKHEELTLDDFNLYKNTALERMNYLLSTLKKLDMKVKDLANTKGKNVKKTAEEVTKESAATDFKRALYDACNNGLITLEQREELLESSMTNMYIESVNSVTYGFDTMSNDDQFKQIRRVLYERCNNGEISLDERDEMLLNARRKYFG